MNTHDPWAILAEQGVLFRLSPTHMQKWEYTVLPLETNWHGPYVSREEALRAALRHLLSWNNSSVNVMSSTESITAQLRMLEQELFALYRARAIRGVTNSFDLEPRIMELLEQIKRIEKLKEQSGDR
jgi:hypothetical protein